MQSQRTPISQALKLNAPAADVRIKGWIRTARDSKNVVFLEVNDGSGFASLQVVLDRETIGFEAAKAATTGSAIEALGTIIASPKAGQPVEMQATKVDIIGLADSSFPLQKKRHSFEYLREISHLRARTNTFSAVFRVRSRLAQSIHRFFHDRNFFYVHTPIITGSDCEGAGEMFRVTTLDLNAPPRDDKGAIDESADFFSKPTYLTVSGQLNGEAYAMGLSQIYTFGPTFRAENSNTARHAAEFWMIEPEVAWADLDDNMDLAEAFVKHCLDTALDECSEDLAFFNDRIAPGLCDRLSAIVKSEFGRISYAEAVKILTASGESFEFPVHFGANLQAEHERYLSEKVMKRPCFVTDYPKEIKAFYMRRNDDGRTVAAMDLLVPQIGELIGGSQREERLDVLKAAILELPHSHLEDYDWYLDTRRFGTAPHAGFGLGFERLLMYVTGMENIRDVIPFPRTPRNARY
jgi:asparaginyl-tRNA synthetase